MVAGVGSGQKGQRTAVALPLLAFSKRKCTCRTPKQACQELPAPTGPGRVAAALRALRPQAPPQSSSYSRTGAGCASGAEGGGGLWRGPGAGPRGENAPSTGKLRKRTHLGPEPGGEGGGRGCGFRPSIPLSVRINDWDIGPVWLWRNHRDPDVNPIRGGTEVGAASLLKADLE